MQQSSTRAGELHGRRFNENQAMGRKMSQFPRPVLEQMVMTQSTSRGWCDVNYSGLNRNVTTSVLACEAGSNFQRFTAFSAAWIKTGLPPIALLSLTSPLGATETSIFTVPLTFIRFANSG